ncbi:MAG: translation initiation factor IF-3 [bacterium]
MAAPTYRINHQIRAKELRVIDAEGNNYGVMPLREALEKAEELGSDLIEISPNAVPPVAKIMDYGKFQYLENKKAKVAKTRATVIEVKTLQVRIGTGDHDLELKAKKASEWLKEGHRIQINLFLPGRSKYLNQDFLKERLQKVLSLITEEYKVADEPKKSPKGWTVLIEKKK